MRISFGNTPNKGLLFLANGIGALVAGGAFLAYVLSRTVGLPGLPVEPDAWLEPLGGASLVAEAVFLAAFALTRRRPVVHSHRA